MPWHIMWFWIAPTSLLRTSLGASGPRASGRPLVERWWRKMGHSSAKPSVSPDCSSATRNGAPDRFGHILAARTAQSGIQTGAPVTRTLCEYDMVPPCSFPRGTRELQSLPATRWCSRVQTWCLHEVAWLERIRFGGRSLELTGPGDSRRRPTMSR
jgi:hypothetical protein